MLTSDQKLLSILCHGSIFLASPILIPIIVLIVSKDGFVKTQAKEALIFQLVMAGGAFVSGILIIILVGIFGLIFFGIASFVMAIIAIINIAEGHDYSYPVTGNWARNM